MIELAASAEISESYFNECMRAPGQPLILRGGAAHWPCASLWTFAYFEELYGGEPLPVMDCLRRPTQVVETTVREYLTYCQRPEGTKLHELAVKHKLAAPFYAYGCRPFDVHPELKAHFQLPAYAHDWCQDMPLEMRQNFYPYGQVWLLFSGVGARSVLHRDDGSTIAWFAQLRGHKNFIVHPKSEGPMMYDGLVDPTRPDLTRFPDYAKSKPVKFTIHPGDLLYLPPDWYHYVRTESPSITLTGNLVNQVNLGDYLRWAFKEQLPRFLSLLPTPAQVT